MVVWICLLENKTTEICGRVFNNLGEGQDQFFISSTNPNAQLKANVSIAKGPNNEILIVWVTKYETFTIIEGRWFELVNSSVEPKTFFFTIYNSSFFQSPLSIATKLAHTCIIVWEELSMLGTGLNIKGQIIDYSGNKIGQNFQINTHSNLDQITPSVTMTSSLIFVVWASFEQDTDGYGIFGQAFDHFGNKLGNEIQVNSEVQGNQLYPIVDFSDSSIEVVWITSDLKIAFQSFSTLSMINDTPFLISFFNTTNLRKFGHRQNSISTEFSDDGKFAFILFSNGVIDIYEEEYLIVKKEINLNTSNAQSMIKFQDILYVLTSNGNFLKIVNVENILNPKTSNFFLNESCNETSEDIEKTFIYASENRLYFGFFDYLCIYNIQNQTIPPIFLRQLKVSFENYNVDLFLDKYKLYYINAANLIILLDTENIENITIIPRIYFFLDKQISCYFVSSNGDFSIFSTSDSFYIYHLKNDLLINIDTYKLTSHISISPDYNLLSLVSESKQNVYILDISQLEKTNQILDYYVGKNVYETKFTIDGNYLLINVDMGIEMVKIVKENKTNETPVLSSIQNNDYYHRFYSWWIDISPSQKTVYVMNNEKSIKCISINDFVSDEYSDGQSTESIFYIYSLVASHDCYLVNDCEEKIQLIIYEFKNETSFALLSELNLTIITPINDYLTSSDENFMFVALFDKTNKTASLFVLNITDKTKPIISSKLNLTTEYPPFLALSKNESELYISLGWDGFFILDISNKSQMNILNNYVNSGVNFYIIISFYAEESNYIAVSNMNEPQFIIFKISDDFKLTQSGHGDLSRPIYGMIIYNERFLIILIQSDLILFSIHDLSNPETFYSVSFEGIDGRWIQIKMVISSLSNTVYFPFGDIAVNLLPTMANDLYGDIVLNPNNDKIEFILNFFPMNVITGTTLKIIDFPNLDSSIKWITIDYPNQRITLYPSTIEEIASLLQPLNIIYSTNIEKMELSSEEINFLRMSEYIDNELYLQKTYDPNEGVLVYDETLSATRMNYILSQHYKTKTIYLSSSLFQKYIPSPSVNLNVQEQTNNLLKSDILIIEETIDFKLADNTFVNPNGFSLTYSVENLPKWLNFNSLDLRFYGTSTYNDRNQNYTIKVIASNGFHKISGSFVLKMRYDKPTLTKNIRDQIRSDPQVALESTYFLYKDTFSDPNNGSLSYECKLNGLVLPSWVNFDETNLLLTITPVSSYFFFLNTYTVNITASNKYFSVSDSFSFKVVASWQFILTLFSQILAGLLGVFGYFKYKSTIYNILFKKYYVYPTKTLVVNSFFEQKIYFLGDDLKQASLLWAHMRKQPSFQIFNANELMSPNFKSKFSQEIKKSRDELILKFKLKEIDDLLLESNGTLFDILECFLYHSLINLPIPANKTYQTMKSQMKREFSKSWCLELMEFVEDTNRNFKFCKFPKVEINEEKLKFRLQIANNKIEFDKDLALFALFRGMIKAEALGIPKYKRNWYQKLIEFSGGECSWIDILQIDQIKIQRVDHKNKMSVIEISGNKKFPFWLDYKISNGILILFGTPHYYDQGTLNFSIIDNDKYIIRSQNLEIKTEIKMGTKTFFDFLGKEKGKENKIDMKEFDSEEAIGLQIADIEDIQKNTVK